ncbi:integrase [Betaproteobacteria bacterium]|nr:integrase [Betaproteobacteria bacterium]GHU45177.1 integrase [Betaproteobacteria bacterium]
MATTDTAIRTAKPGTKDYRITDERGLYLIVATKGGKLWRFDYRHGIKPGTDKPRRLTLALGTYPDVSLKEARDKRDEARKLLANGIDPGEHRKAHKAALLGRAANSFEVVAREWLEKWKSNKAASHIEKVSARLENDVFPWLGERPVADISAPEVLEVLRRIERRGAIETAHRAKQNISQIMRYAISTGRALRDPCPDLKDALMQTKGGHFASLTDPASVGKLMRDIDSYTGGHIVRAALALTPLVFVRPGELRNARWADIDFEKGEWCYTTSKTSTEHIVPLSRQALEILNDLYPATGHSGLVFKGQKPGKPISDATVNSALRRMGYDTQKDITGHGFRAMARTLLAEELDQTPDWIERQLAHVTSETNGTAYDRAQFLKHRRPMMQVWADYLDKLKWGNAGADAG